MVKANFKEEREIYQVVNGIFGDKWKIRWYMDYISIKIEVILLHYTCLGDISED